jgi:hypothetical protein
MSQVTTAACALRRTWMHSATHDVALVFRMHVRDAHVVLSTTSPDPI